MDLTISLYKQSFLLSKNNPRRSNILKHNFHSSCRILSKQNYVLLYREERAIEFYPGDQIRQSDLIESDKEPMGIPSEFGGIPRIRVVESLTDPQCLNPTGSYRQIQSGPVSDSSTWVNECVYSPAIIKMNNNEVNNK